MRKSENITILIPVFNNADSLTPLSIELKELNENQNAKYKVLFVDDGSSDNSFDLIKKLSGDNSGFHGIQLDKNYGQVPAILTGLKYLDSDACIIMSADLQEPIALINEMLIKWRGGKELVIAKRAQRKDAFLAAVFSRLLFSLIALFLRKVPQKGFDFGLLDKSVYKELIRVNPFLTFLQIAVFRYANSFDSVYYIREESFAKKSNWSLRKKLKYSLNALLELDHYFLTKLFVLTFLLLLVGYMINGVLKPVFLVFALITIVMAMPILYYLISNSFRSLPKVKEVV